MWLCEEKPRSSDSWASGTLPVFSNVRDWPIRRRFMKRLRLRPVDCWNFLAKWLGDKPKPRLISSSDPR